MRRLLARGAVKVYAASKDGVSEVLQPGVALHVVDPESLGHASALAQRLDDVTLLVNCLVAVQQSPSTLAGADIQPPGRRSPPAGRTLKLFDAFAPVLGANGGEPW